MTIEEEIKSRFYEDLDRPWGFFKRFTNNENCTVKIITVNPGGVLSKQEHKNRDELWIILDGGLRVEVGNEIKETIPGDEIVIPRKTTHRLECIGKREARLLEICFGEFEEDDIRRYEDIYGRK